MPDPLSHGHTSKALFGRQFSQTSQASGFSDALSTVCTFFAASCFSLHFKFLCTILQSSDRKVISQKSKKKPDPVDVALENDGLCRKLMPRDGNTIFRAVSDQVCAFTLMSLGCLFNSYVNLSSMELRPIKRRSEKCFCSTFTISKKSSSRYIKL